MRMAGTGIVLTVLTSARSIAQKMEVAPAFEITSVKPTDPKISIMGMFTYPGGKVTATKYTLEMLIEEAFDIESFQLSGGPDWMTSERFDIIGQPPAASESSKSNPPYRKFPPNSEQRQMLQTLLADRFKLSFHHDSKEGPVYLLVRGTKDLKLQDSANAKEYPWVGGVGGGSIIGAGISAKNASMSLLATRLGRYLERPVIDKTDIGGSYDFRIDYDSGEPNPDIISSIFASIQGIGLKLEAARGPVGTMVIDHAEKPTAN